MKRECVLAATLVLAFTASVSLHGQGAQRDLSSLATRTGQIVYVLERGGAEVLARVQSATSSQLLVTVGGTPRAFNAAEIARVSIAGDSIRNGTLIGGVVGVGAGFFSLQGSPCTTCGRAAAQILAGVAISAALGAWVDARKKGRTVVYRASPP